MALVIKDRVRQTSTTAGTGTITLSGSVTGYQDFSVIGTGNTTYYTIADQSGSNWEVGLGTYTSPNQLARTTVYESSNANALVNFGSNTKDVFVTLPAEGFASPPAIGGTTPNTITGTTVTANTIINLPAVTNIDSTVGKLEMVDGGDGYDYLNIWTDSGGYSYSVNFPGGLSATGNIASGSFSTLGNFWGQSDGISPGELRLSFLDNNYISLIAPTTGTPYTLTLPSSSGSANQVLKTDGTGVTSWTTIDPLTLTGISDPSAPSGTNTTIYSKSFGGNVAPTARNALNKSFAMQAALWSKNVHMWTCTNSTGGSWLNSAGNSAGTFTAVTPTAGSTLYQTIRRSTYANVITTTNQVLGVNSLYLSFFRGSVASQGGFFFYTRCGFDVWTNGGRFFAGMATNNTTIVNTNPSGVNNSVGFCVDSGDNGAISFLTRGTAATKASTGYTITSNTGYDLYIYCSPNSSQYTWMITDINAGTSATGTATLNLPTNTQTQQPTVLASNAALTPATSISLGIAKIYCESDY
jgi:hypothetical protein